MNRPERESTSVPLTEASFRQVSWPRGQDYQARPCLDLRLDDVESSNLVFLRRRRMWQTQRTKKESPRPHKGNHGVRSPLLVRAAAQDIRSQKALGTFHELIFHGFALVKSPVAIFLNSRKMDEDIFSGRALNEAIAFGSVEPLHSSLLFHKCNSFRLSFRLEISASSNAKGGEKGCCFAGEMLFSASDGCRAGRPKGRLQQPDRSASSNCCTKTSTKCAPRDKPPGAEHNIQELWFL